MSNTYFFNESNNKYYETTITKPKGNFRIFI